MASSLSLPGEGCEFLRATDSHLAKPYLCRPRIGVPCRIHPPPMRSGAPLGLRQGWLFLPFRDLPQRRKQGR